MTETIAVLTDATIDEEIRGSAVPIVVDFWAEWCGPCRMMDPVLEDLAREQAGRVRVARLDVDDNPDAVRRYDAMSIPTLLLFRDGRPVKRLVGARGKAHLLEELSDALG